MSHMRIRVPDIPHAVLSAASTTLRLSSAEAIDRIAVFLGLGNVAVLTGAGVSVDSGIRAYRGQDGRYMNPDYKCICRFLARFHLALMRSRVGPFCTTSSPIKQTKVILSGERPL